MHVTKGYTKTINIAHSYTNKLQPAAREGFCESSLREPASWSPTCRSRGIHQQSIKSGWLKCWGRVKIQDEVLVSQIGGCMALTQCVFMCVFFAEKRYDLREIVSSFFYFGWCWAPCKSVTPTYAYITFESYNIFWQKLSAQSSTTKPRFFTSFNYSTQSKKSPRIREQQMLAMALSLFLSPAPSLQPHAVTIINGLTTCNATSLGMFSESWQKAFWEARV